MNVDFRPKTLLLAAFTASVVAQGCTFLLDREKQCGSDTDCKKFGASAICVDGVCQEATPSAAPMVSDAGSQWACLGNVVQSASSLTGQVSVGFGFFDLSTSRPVTNLIVRPCPKLDVTCANPIGPQVSPDGAGMVNVTVPVGFDGYVEIADSVPDASNGYIHSLFFMNPLPFEDMNYGVMPVFSTAIIAQLAASQGNTIDPAAGFIFSGARDCLGAPAAGVSWEPDRSTADTRRFFYVDGLPSEAAVATDATGYGGLINVPIGTIRLFAKRLATGQSIGSATVFARASQISFVFLAPSP